MTQRPAVPGPGRRSRQIQDIAANAPDPYYAAPKVAWLLENEPDLRQRTTHLLMANGYVNMRLTGHRSIDSGHAGLCLLAGIEDVRWSSELAELWGIPVEWLPPIGHPADVLGAVSPEAAAATGLRPGTAVVHGGVDGATASLAAGVAAEGDICAMTGQSTVLNAAVGHQALAKGLGALSVFAYPVPGLYLLFGAMSSTGGILRWFRDQFGDAEQAEAAETGEDAFAVLDRLAGTAPAGSGGLLLLPYFLGERAPIWDSDARGVLLGLSMSTQRSHVVRSILEGTAYGLNHNIERCAPGACVPRSCGSSVVAPGAGPGTRSSPTSPACRSRYPQETSGAPVGSALLAAVGAGIEDDLAKAAHTRYRADERFRPMRRATAGTRASTGSTGSSTRRCGTAVPSHSSAHCGRPPTRPGAESDHGGHELPGYRRRHLGGQGGDLRRVRETRLAVQGRPIPLMHERGGIRGRWSRTSTSSWPRWRRW